MEDRYGEETRTLRELLEIMHEHDLETLKIKLGDTVYELSRRDTAQAAPPAQFSSAGPGADDGPLAAPANATKVLAPLTGVFYRAASPDVAPYVEIGSRVEAGDVLCVLEAMKLFNEIQSDDSGTILRIVPENGELVSQGDELFWIER
jgi:acetyl-CoA carboxylase biotin carboxyl carrier protein